jgi:2,4-dienoyl-CoA reductase-like NADH-dependent reductase (Old Yellow Enzyme family)
MTRSKSPEGIPGADVAAYYRRRAEGGVGLIVTEGTTIGHIASGFDPNVPRFYGEKPLAAWKNVAAEVHAAGGLIVPQLWHVGVVHRPEQLVTVEGSAPMSPSGQLKPGSPDGVAMTQADIDAAVDAFGKAARAAKELDFDGIELHGAHGYLIDQFFWDGTNLRTDKYGGSLVARTRFAVEVIEEVRRQIGPDFPLIFRFSQWKLQDYAGRLVTTPQQFEQFLEPLTRAGVDVFHCSQRRFWEPEFPGSNLNLAGWAKKLTGKPTITVGSVTLNEEFMTTFQSPAGADVTGIDELVDRLAADEFDLVAIGRALITNPDWPRQVAAGGVNQLRRFDRSALATLS